MLFRLFTRELWKTHARLKPSEMEAYLWKFEEVQVDVEKKIQDRLVQRPRAVRTRTLLIIDALRLEPLVSNRRWVEILRALPDDSPDGIKFTEKEVEAILGGNSTRILNLD